ncbi:saxitoxin and tetrodotoxin-binding protein 1-like [Xiphophorus couchianus]|uniref:saxitoxin and tetrodotoxin-binding protein 1-like n=1 Tax=Xiphophorus couchianus TaxID=32473 RepID=UPI0010162A9D|nr:saxitoxin and tetrodotoxin-binding protein 1-like [Xiphophorus couchianus]
MSGVPAAPEQSVDLLLSTMTVTHLAVVLVSLLSFSAAAPAEDECSQMTRTLTAEQIDQILGRWIFIEGTVKNDFFGPVLDHIESMWMVLNRTADNQTLMLNQANLLAAQQQPEPMNGQCLRSAVNVTLVRGKDLEFHIPAAASYHRFLHTCSDCLLMHTYNNENHFQMFYLFGRNTTVAASDLNVFRKQAECLRFPLPSKFQYDTSKELCPA